MSLTAAKVALRKEIKAKLSILTQEQVVQQSKLVLEKLLKDEKFTKCNRVAIYLHMQREIETLDIIKYLFENKKQCFIPNYIVGGSLMTMVPLYSMEDFEKLPMTKWKIKQPAADDLRPEALETGGLDAVIAPGVGFTLEGKRLGHGRGYYDSYLQRCIAHSNGKPYYIGLALQPQIVPDLPIGPTDVLVDKVLVADG